MKLNKSAYLFAAALVAGTVGMTSCSSEDVIDATEQGVENKVTLALSVADKFGTRSTANEVNLGTELQSIENVVVVPMIGETYQAPIAMGELDPKTDRTKETTANLNTSVTKFKVYGNLPSSVTIDDKKQFTNFTITLDQADDASNKVVDNAQTYTIGTKTAYAPYGLYYYGVAGVTGNPIKAGDTKESVSEVNVGEAVGSKKYVSLEKVNYAVGVLAAAVINGDAVTNYISNEQTGDNPSSPVTSDDVKISGIIIDGQSKTLDQDFSLNTDASNLVSVYEEVATGKETFSTDPIAQGNASNGNLYVVVAATGTEDNIGNTVTGNLEFTLAQGKFIKTANGVIGSADAPFKFYLPFTLKPQTGKAVFMKDFSTILNATVKSWGMASKTPVEVTDATIAVTVDVDWQAGITYNEEI